MSSLALPDLMGVLRERQEQAGTVCAPYLAPVANDDTMLYWLAKAAKGLREAAGRKQVHVAAGADVDQSSVWRFEEKGRWPRDPDKIIRAYADDLDIEPIQIWGEAIRLWNEQLAAPAEVHELKDRLVTTFQEHDPTADSSGSPDPQGRPKPRPKAGRNGKPARGVERSRRG